MRLVEEFRTMAGGVSQTYEGEKGMALLKKNCGNRDDRDRWQLAVVIGGEYKLIGKRIEYKKALAMAEQEIG